jgi:hypothetical protein
VQGYQKKGGPAQSLNNEPNIICLDLSELVMLNQLVKARAKTLEKTKSKRSHLAETDEEDDPAPSSGKKKRRDR